MLSRRWGQAAAACLLAVLALLPAADASGQRLGSNLKAAADTRVCTLSASSSQVTSCTYEQLLLSGEDTAVGGLQPQEEGVITSWRVSSGIAAGATQAVKMRLHLIDPALGASFTGGSPYVELPLNEPGIHEFPADLYVPKGMRVALDLVVSGFSGAAAPIAHAGNDGDTVAKWIPALKEGLLAPMPAPTQDNLELLFGVTLEADRDRDGYGDKTQDRCPKDPKHHLRCDTKPPRTKLTYAPRQDFLHNGKIVVYLRSSETGPLYASGQIDIANLVTWGIYSDKANTGRGEKRRLVLRVPPRARRAAARSFAHGRRVVAKISASAADVAGNESGIAVAVVKPRR